MKNGHSDVVIPLVTPHWASAVAENENGRIPRHHLTMVDGENVVLLFWREYFRGGRIFFPIPFTAIRAPGISDVESVLHLYDELGWYPLFTSTTPGQKHLPCPVMWHAADPHISLRLLINKNADPEMRETMLHPEFKFVYDQDPMTRYTQHWRVQLERQRQQPPPAR